MTRFDSRWGEVYPLGDIPICFKKEPSVLGFFYTLAAPGDMSIWTMIGWWLLIIASMVVLVGFLVVGQFFNLWLQGFMAGASVSLFDLIGMRLRKVDSRQIVLSKISGVQAGLDISTKQLESHYL